MRRSFKKSLLRSSAMATFVVASAIGLNAPAQAATFSNASFSFDGTTNPTRCSATVTFDATYEVTDNNGNQPSNQIDAFQVNISRTNGPGGLNLGSGVSAAQGIRTTSGTGFFTTNSSQQTGEIVAEFFDSGPNGPGNPVLTLTSTPAQLRAAGIGCARIADGYTTPTANAGSDSQVGNGDTVTLDGSASTPGTPNISYQWVQTGGPAVAVNNPTSPVATFTVPSNAPIGSVFNFRLTVSDETETVDDSVEIEVVANQAPVVDAGPDQTVAGGSNVNLAGTASDPDNDPLRFNWTQISGPSVTLADDTTLTPSFVAPPRAANAQVLTFGIEANDFNASTADSVEITVLGNQGPTADAGQPQTVAGESAVNLDATASSDPEGDALIYNWTQITGPVVSLTGANTATPSFTAPVRAGTTRTLVFEVRITDTFDASSTAQVTITVPPNQLPVADAGPDQSLTGNSTVTLDGSGSSDPDGDPINYSWTQTGGPSVTLSNSDIVNPTFVAPAGITTNQVLTFRLTVDDGSNSNAERLAPSNPQQDTVEITILANSPPVADAGADQGPIDAGQTVTLDGSGSSDPDGDTLGFTWTQVSGTPVTLTGGTSPAPTFIAPVVNGNEDLVFSLIVDDGQQQSVADTVIISVRAVGTVTIIQQVIGGDAAVTFTSDIAALNSSFTTVGGTGQVSAADVATGSYLVSVNDLRTAGFALTDITCNDADSIANIAARSVDLELSPGEDLVCTFTSTNSRGAAQAAIADFLTGRNALILSHQPDLQRRLDRLNGGQAQGGSASAFGLPVPGSGGLPFALQLSSGQASGSTSLAMIQSAVGGKDRPASDFDIWGEAFFSDARLGSQDASFRIFHIGADYKIGDKVLIGALAEFDSFRDRGDLEAGEAEGDGFMVGPYAMARLAPELFAEVRAAWGGSDNTVNPLGTFTDEFETSRSFYSGSLVGQFDIGKSTQVRPEFTVRYLDETQQAYTDSLGVIIPEQAIGQGDVSFRPRFQQVVRLQSGWTLRPFVEAEGIYTFGTEANSILDNGLRARIEGGLDVLSTGGIRASIGAFHDGIGAENFESSGVHVSLSFGF